MKKFITQKKLIKRIMGCGQSKASGGDGGVVAATGETQQGGGNNKNMSAAAAAAVSTTTTEDSASAPSAATGSTAVAPNHVKAVGREASNSASKQQQQVQAEQPQHQMAPPHELQQQNEQKSSGYGDWSIRPGYSSGASSYAGSDDEEKGSSSGSGRRRVDSDDLSSSGVLQRSKHSHILALDELKQEMVAEGDLTKTVVRIETPFGKPIEEIYAGVQDGPVLGSGVSGIVRLVTHRATGVKYAVKCLDIGLIDTAEGLRQLRNEIFIMCQLDHPNIVRIEEVYESTNEIYIVQELCVGGDLFDRLDQQTDYHYTEAQCARLVKQMLSSVRYLHSKGIIHRDLKLENFLFSSVALDSELKMIDFGLSKHFSLGENLHEKVGTPYTVAPEIIRGTYNEKSDIWALGVITYLLLSGETPFGGLDGENLLMVKENIMRAKVFFEPADVWAHVSDSGKAFVKRLLNPDPEKRPTAKEGQKDTWIQVWAKKDASAGKRLDDRTISALMTFKEQSDMQKLLSEVLSFTLLPEQIVELREEFEKIDSDGDGEISLMAMKRVLMQNAEAGALGSLTEEEIDSLFDAIRIRKSDPKIRWHDFLAAGLSQARVDDRNLRLAFDRLDTDRKGFITFSDLQDLLGASTESDALEEIWLESLEECKAHLNRISYDDFKRLMKGQSKEATPAVPSLRNPLAEPSSFLRNSVLAKEADKPLDVVVEGKAGLKNGDSKGDIPEETDEECLRFAYAKKRSRSYEQQSPVWLEEEKSAEMDSDSRRKRSLAVSETSRALLLPLHADGDIDGDDSMSPLATNRALYRKHREMRLAVLDASKQFDRKRNERRAGPVQAGLIMKRGIMPPVELEDTHTRALFDAAAKRCGRSCGRARRAKNKTKSDITGMLLKS